MYTGGSKLVYDDSKYYVPFLSSTNDLQLILLSPEWGLNANLLLIIQVIRLKWMQFKTLSVFSPL